MALILSDLNFKPRFDVIKFFHKKMLSLQPKILA